MIVCLVVKPYLDVLFVSIKLLVFRVIQDIIWMQLLYALFAQLFKAVSYAEIFLHASTVVQDIIYLVEHAYLAHRFQIVPIVQTM